MRKHIFLFFLALIFFSACSDTPKGIIGPREMTSLLVDVHIADGSLYYIDAPNADSLYKYGFNRYIAVFKRHHIDSIQFKNSLKYYTLHPKQMEAMYTAIIPILQAKLDSISKIQISQPAKNALPKK